MPPTRETIQYVVPLGCGHFVNMPTCDHDIVTCSEGHTYEIALKRDSKGDVYTIETRRVVATRAA